MVFAIIYGLIGAAYSLAKAGEFKSLLHTIDWADALFELISPEKFLILSAFWPIGMGIDLYQKLILDDDDLIFNRRKTKRKPQPKRKDE